MIIGIIGAALTAASIIASIVIAKHQHKERTDDKTDSKILLNEQIDIDAKRFIQQYRVGEDEHKAEVYLLPLCVSAYKYDSTRSYRRQIYRDFCLLSEDVQNRILELYELDLKSQKYPDYFESMLDIVTNIIRKEHPHDRDVFYEGGKYFERAILHHGNKQSPNIVCDIDEDWKNFEESHYNSFFQPRTSMPYDFHIKNLMEYHKTETPIEQLMEEPTSMGIPVDSNTDEIVMSYLCCKIAEQSVLCEECSEEERDRINKKQLGYSVDYQGERYMEDEFLYALHIIENYVKGEQ